MFGQLYICVDVELKFANDNTARAKIYQNNIRNNILGLPILAK